MRPTIYWHVSLSLQTHMHQSGRVTSSSSSISHMATIHGPRRQQIHHHRTWTSPTTAANSHSHHCNMLSRAPSSNRYTPQLHHSRTSQFIAFSTVELVTTMATPRATVSRNHHLQRNQRILTQHHHGSASHDGDAPVPDNGAKFDIAVVRRSNYHYLTLVTLVLPS